MIRNHCNAVHHLAVGTLCGGSCGFAGPVSARLYVSDNYLIAKSRPHCLTTPPSLFGMSSLCQWPLIKLPRVRYLAALWPLVASTSPAGNALHISIYIHISRKYRIAHSIDVAGLHDNLHGVASVAIAQTLESHTLVGQVGIRTPDSEAVKHS